jgi:hypothetical protein
LVRGQRHPDPVADSETIDVRTDGIDDARTILVRHGLDRVAAAVQARTSLPVGRVHARDRHPNPYFAARRLGDLAIHQTKYGVGGSQLVMHDCLHTELQPTAPLPYSTV